MQVQKKNVAVAKNSLLLRSRIFVTFANLCALVEGVNKQKPTQSNRRCGWACVTSHDDVGVKVYRERGIHLYAINSIQQSSMWSYAAFYIPSLMMAFCQMPKIGIPRKRDGGGFRLQGPYIWRRHSYYTCSKKLWLRKQRVFPSIYRYTRYLAGNRGSTTTWRRIQSSTYANRLCWVSVRHSVCHYSMPSAIQHYAVRRPWRPEE